MMVCRRLTSSLFRTRLLLRTSDYKPGVSVCYCTATTDGPEANASLPKHSRIVICGGGIIGSSIAYHLTAKGERDVLVLEKSRVAEGGSSYSTGIVGQLKSNPSETKMIQYSNELYRELSDQHGLKWADSGALFLARTEHRQHKFERMHATAQHTGTETQLLTGEQVQAKYPYIQSEDMVGALWIPRDIIVDARGMNLLLAKLSQQNGATFIEDCGVLEVRTCKNNTVTSLLTSLGEVECDYFVNAAGQWARMVGKLSRPRIRVPVHSVEHYFMLARLQQPLDTNMPVIRDYDNHCYFRPWGDCVMAGAFEKKAKPIFHGGVPEGFSCARDRITADWDQLQFSVENVIRAIPALTSATMDGVVTGTEPFSPDRHWILGQVPELHNYYLAAGFCGAGTAAAGGVGKRLAELILDNERIPWHDPVDVKRFVGLHNNIKYLRDRVAEVVGFDYGTEGARPDKHFKSSRSLRVSPLYTRCHNANAAFGEIVGYERPMYFKSNAPEEESLNMQKTCFGKPSYFDIVKTEYISCRQNVCLVDMSSFAKVEIRSDSAKDVTDFLQYVCANDVDRPTGTVIHSAMLNHRGGYENDCSLFRVEESKFLVVSPAPQQTRNLWWLREHLPAHSTVQISDITSMYTVLNVIGPKARELLGELTDVSLKVADFPHMFGKPLYVANAGDVLAMRLTHAGEDGFMLYVPSEYALHVYDTLMRVGKNYGVRNAGYYALKSLRTERFFAYWGSDLGADVTPLECGRDHWCKLSSDVDFIGRDALLKQRSEGIKRKFIMLRLTNHDEATDNFPWAGEPIFRNGRHVGNVTSSAYGYTLGCIVCLGFIRNYEDENGIVSLSYITDKNAKYEIAIGTQLFSAKIYAYPPKIEAANLGFYLPTMRVASQE